MPPQLIRDRQRFNLDAPPPGRLVAPPVQLAMVGPTQGDREFITDLTAKRPRLSKTQMMGIGWGAAAHQARLGGYEFAVITVAQANSFGWDRAAATADVV